MAPRNHRTQGARQGWISGLHASSNRTSTKSRAVESDKLSASVRYRETLLQSVDAVIEPPATTNGYRVALVIVALMVVTVPILYVVTAVASIWIYFRHVIGNAILCLHSLTGFVLYLIPTFFGPFVIFYLFKPFFVRTSAGQKLIELKRSEEPELYAFVEQLCECLGSPQPSSICINMHANASAGFANNNPFSSKLRLIIGIPLIYRLTFRQFAGVLAHEFGHFSQRAGMRLSFLVRAINGWLTYSLASRDATDEWLENHLTGNAMAPLRWSLYIGVSVARSVIWFFLCLSNAMSFFLMRQMEFDADKAEVALVGDACFMATQRRVVALAYAEEFAFGDLQEFFREGRLVDDFPRLIATSLDEVSPRLRKRIDEHESMQTTRWFDTHPSQEARFENALQNATPGVFQIPENFEKVAASVLFRSIRKHAEKCTLDFYKTTLGSRFNDGLLYPIEEMIERKKVEAAAARTLNRYFQVQMPAFYPFPLAKDAAEPCENLSETVQELKWAREEMRALCKDYRRLIDRHSCAEESQMDASSLAMLHQANVRVDMKNDALARTSAIDYARMAEHGLGNLALAMLEYESAAGQRLSAALRLGTHPSVVAKLPDGKSVCDDIVRLVGHTLEVVDVMGDLRGIRLASRRAIVSIHHLDANIENMTFIEMFVRQLDMLYEMLKSLYWKIGRYDYPFDHAEGDKSLGEVAMPSLPEEYNLASMFYVANIAFERLATTQMRLFGRLAVLAEKVETAVGFKPMPDYVPQEDNERGRS